MDKQAKIFVAGHRGMAGTCILLMHHFTFSSLLAARFRLDHHVSHACQGTMPLGHPHARFFLTCSLRHA